MSVDRARGATSTGDERLVRDDDDAPADGVGPAVITILVWGDREPDLNTGGLAEWVAVAALERALYNLLPDVEDDPE